MSEKSTTLIVIGSTSGLTTGCRYTRKKGYCRANDHRRSCTIFFNKSTYEKLIKDGSLLTVKLNKIYGHFDADDQKFSLNVAAFPCQILNFFADEENRRFFNGTFRVISCQNLTTSHGG